MCEYNNTSINRAVVIIIVFLFLFDRTTVKLNVDGAFILAVVNTADLGCIHSKFTCFGPDPRPKIHIVAIFSRFGSFSHHTNLLFSETNLNAVIRFTCWLDVSLKAFPKRRFDWSERARFFQRCSRK